MLRRALLVLVSFLGIALVVAACGPRKGSREKSKATLALRLASPFHGSRLHTTLIATLEGSGLDARSTEPVKVTLRDESGRPAEVQTRGVPVEWEVAIGRAEIGLVVGDLPAGKYELCAALSAAKACAPLILFQTAPDPCVDKFVKAVLANPNFGCRCKRGEIRLGGQAPDGSLGSFNADDGGDVTGPFARGTLAGTALTSNFKWEAHFEVEAVNDPGRPAECSEEVWRELTYGVLCSEGQLVNRSVSFSGGAIVLTNGTAGISAPYDPSPNAVVATDGHGYKAPVDAAPGMPVTGELKAYDAGVIHWLDAPGVYNKPTRVFRGLAPMHADHGFFTYVRGSSGTDADSCTCRFAVRAAVIDAAGAAQPGSVLSPATCN